MINEIYSFIRNITYLKGKSYKLDYFFQKDKVYLASADQFNGFNKIFTERKKLTCKNFYCVIGGMGGLNIVSILKDVKNIIFFDINPYSIQIAKFYVTLIQNSRDIDDFISLFYLRIFNSKKYNSENQIEYLKKEVDNKLKSRLKKILGNNLFKFYLDMYYPYIKTPTRTIYDGPSTHCTNLTLFHDAQISDPMVNPFLSSEQLVKEGKNNFNSLFFGKGWLKNNQSFDKVKKTLINSNIKIIRESIFDLKFLPDSGLYSSNVFSGDEHNFSETINKYSWVIWYSKSSHYLLVDEIKLGSRQIPFKKLYGKNITNTHKSCTNILDNELKLDKNNFIEVIEPHITEGLNFGFRFYKGQIPISVDNFLKNDIDISNVKYIGIHILLGNGCQVNKWKLVIKKALSYKISIFIFEHRKLCRDWPEWDVYENNILNENKIDLILLKKDKNWVKFGCANKFGDDLDIRNICWINYR